MSYRSHEVSTRTNSGITTADSPASRARSAVDGLVSEMEVLCRQISDLQVELRHRDEMLDALEGECGVCRHCGKALPSRAAKRVFENLGVAFELSQSLLWSCGYCSDACNERANTRAANDY